MVVRYISNGVPRSVSPGRVLMHNHVQHTVDMPVGLNGFRAWTDASPPPTFEECKCGWSGLPHYRAAAPMHLTAKQRAEVNASRDRCQPGPWEQLLKRQGK